MVSDGRVVRSPLAKIECAACGSVSHETPINDQEARRTYSEGYLLASAAPVADDARAGSYAEWLASRIPEPRSVVEIGCGSGALLRQLASRWESATFFGVDPAAPEGRRNDDRVQLRRGFVEDLPRDASADLVVAINVIEHVALPSAFLGALRAHLLPGGRISVVCPAIAPPNVELLFFDHLYSYTPVALRDLGRSAELAVQKWEPAPGSIGDFQLTLYGEEPARSGVAILDQEAASSIGDARRAYLESWAGLDRSLLDRIPPGGEVLAFGAGQMAALLRAYAPRTWARIGRLLVDRPDDAWRLDKPVARYLDAGAIGQSCTVILATAPGSQRILYDRLRDDGHSPVRFDDIVTH